MSDADGPPEFKSVRPARSPAAWLAERGRRDAQVYAGFAAFLVPCGIAATLGLFAVLFGVLYLLNPCGVLPKTFTALAAIAAVTGLFVYGFKSARDGLRRVEVLTPSRGLVGLRLSRLTGSSWMLLFENHDDRNPVVRTVLNLALLAPRLFLMSRRTWRLSQRLKVADFDLLGRAGDLLMSAGKRVSLVELIEEFPQSDPQTLIDDLTEIDGVVLLLIADDPGLAVTPSFVEDYEAWRQQARKRRRGE